MLIAIIIAAVALGVLAGWLIDRHRSAPAARTGEARPRRQVADTRGDMK